MTLSEEPTARKGLQLPRNVWILTATSFLTDISSDMIANLIPLFLYNVLGVRTSVVGLIDGIAETTASLMKLFSGAISDRMGKRKSLTVLGYGLSTLAKPFLYLATTWGWVLGVRFTDRLGKGIRTAPRDALVADSVDQETRGLAFGFQRAADTGGAVLGIVVAIVVIWLAQRNSVSLGESTFRTVVLISLAPAALAVLTLALGARDVPIAGERQAPKLRFKSLGRSFVIFMLIMSVFDLGNSSDAFLILRAQERGMSVIGILVMLMAFNLIYALVSAPAGGLSDRLGRRRMITAGWLVYAAIYLGFGLAARTWHIVVLFILYGFYYALAYSTAKAFVADLVPETVRGTAYGTYNAVLGILDFPASVIAGVLWQGVGGWPGLGPSAPFLFGAGTALLASLMMLAWKPGAPRGRM